MTEPALVERRVWRNLYVVIAAALLLAALLAGWRFTLGLALGCGLAVFNFKWLQTSLRDILATSTEGKVAPGASMQFLTRWIIIGAVSYGAHLTGLVDAAAVITGLLAPAAAIIIEAFYVGYKMLVQDGGR